MGKEQLIPLKLTTSQADASDEVVKASAIEPTADRVTFAEARDRQRAALASGGASANGATPWRTLDELAGSEQFEQVVNDEFPRYAPSSWEDEPSRRSFMQLAGASVGLAGLTACTRQPREKIVPYVEQPEHVVPGKPVYYATSMTQAGIGQPLLAESHMGRPTKVAGNPEHPSSSGAADLFAQASILGLYDPDRSRGVQRDGRESFWGDFQESIQPAMKAQEALGGTGLRILTGAVSSPTLVDQMNRLRERFPQAKWVQYEAANNDASVAASQVAFGEVVDTTYDLAKADVIVALDSEFLSSGPAHLQIAADFASRRQVVREDGGGGHHGEASSDAHAADADPIDMNRLYALECVPSPTGAVADHRIGVTPAELGQFSAALAAGVGVGVTAPTLHSPKLSEWVAAIADDLRAHAGASVVIPGQFAGAAVHVLAHAINAALGNVGRTVTYRESAIAEPASNAQGLAQLAHDMHQGAVDVLVVLGANPVFDAPGELEFGAAMSKVATTVHAGLYEDETRGLSSWHIPLAHYLEGWGDCRGFDGTVGLQQPLIEPLFDGKTEAEIVSGLLGEDSDGYDLVRASWRARLGAAGFDTAWHKALHDGYLQGSASAVANPAINASAVSAAASDVVGAHEDGLTLIVRPDPTLFDGRYANNGWLQETPKPITKVTWDQVALVAPATMKELGFEPNTKVERMITVEANGRSIELPILLSIGQAPNTVAIAMGHGRTHAGAVGNREENGANVQSVLNADSGFTVAGVTIADTGREYKVAATQEHFQISTNRLEEGYQMEQARDRHLIKQGTKSQYEADPHFASHLGPHVPENASMFPDWEYKSYAWGMAINLNSCTGCNACLLACQAENNIPVVGRDQIIRGREMHWLRIDRYYDGDVDSPKIHHQPVACMHCERAPCELVCPVGATTHSDEGLNDMAYNRCIGTRYCSNNCPYKVRRFNFLSYNDHTTPILKMARNPDVTVRTRGVMEKCTYCTQRISKARIQAQIEGRKIQDGEIKTACQETCPTGAITFGDINDSHSEVSRWKRSALNYQLLDELATVPRTTYLAKLTNPNPALADHDSHGDGAAAAAH